MTRCALLASHSSFPLGLSGGASRLWRVERREVRYVWEVYACARVCFQAPRDGGAEGVPVGALRAS